jgi:DNA repair protein RecO (recombination protein O)
METYTATGITLLVRKYRGSERIATFYTRESGKVEAVVSGVGKPGSKLAGALEPFTLSRLFFNHGRSLERLTQAQVVEVWSRIGQEVTSYGYGAWIAELTARATEPGEPNPELFATLEEHLRALNEGASSPVVAAAYGLVMLEHLGVAPVLDRCARCGVRPAGIDWYDAEAGGLVCAACRPPAAELVISPGHRALLRGLRRMATDRLYMLHPSDADLRQILLLLRRHIAFHLGFTLKSDGFLSQLTA